MLRRSVSGESRSSARSRSSCIPRIYGPRNFKDEYARGDLKAESRAVLAKIERCYNHSRLKHFEGEFIYGGFCFGLLDPTSNIVVNSFMSSARRPEGGGGGGRAQQAAGMIQRSLEGLVAFLTCLFPYLPEVEALRYLDAAGADPLIASQLIVNRRGMEQSFRIDSGTTVTAVEIALRCAAVTARHPDPHRLVLGWKLVSSDLKKLIMPKGDYSLSFLKTLLDRMMAHATPDEVLQLRVLGTRQISP